MALRATATAGHGRSANVNTDSITVPTTGVGGAVIAGDTALIELCAVSTGGATPVTPSGWSIASPGILLGTTSEYSIVYGKTLVSGDIGAAVTLAWTGFVRPCATMAVESGVSFAGRQVPVPIQNATGGGQTTAPALPTQGSVAAGSTVYSGYSRRNAVIGGTTVTPPSGYTEVVEAQTAYADPADAIVTMGRKVAATAGTYGGESGVSTPTTAGVNYLIVLPSAGNAAPVANAGADQTNVEPGALVTIGGVDTDSDGTIASIAWTQIAGTTTPLSSTTVASPTLTAPPTTAGTTLTYRKVVTDNSGTDSAPDDVNITVLPATEFIAIGGVWVPAVWRVL